MAKFIAANQQAVDEVLKKKKPDLTIVNATEDSVVPDHPAAKARAILAQIKAKENPSPK